MYMKSHEEMIQSLYARREAYERKKLKRKRATIRVTGIAACFLLCTAVLLGSYGQSEPPVTPTVSEESEQSLQGENSKGDSFTEESSEQPDVSSPPPEESSEDPDNPSLPPEGSERTPIYSEIRKVERDVPALEGDIVDGILGGGIFVDESVNSTTFGHALTLKMLLKSDEPAYLFNVVVYMKVVGEEDGDGMLSDACAMITQDETAGISTGDWLPVEWFTEGNAYYCRLTARELFVLNSYGIACLYVGSGEGDLKQAETQSERIDAYCELYGDFLVGVKK